MKFKNKKSWFWLLFFFLFFFFYHYRYSFWAKLRNELNLELIITGITRGKIVNFPVKIAGVKEKIGGGYTYYFSAILQEMKRCKRFGEKYILLDLGDNLYGSPYLYFTRGKIYSKYLYFFPEKGFILGGNLDFLYGEEVFRRRMRESGWQPIISNLFYYSSGTRPDFAFPFVIKNIMGIKIAILGFSPENTDNSMLLGREKKFRLETDFMALKDEIELCRQEGADLIIVMSQYDFYRFPDRLKKAKKFVEKCGVDVLIGLHFDKFIRKTINYKGHLLTSLYGLSQGVQLKVLKLKIDLKKKRIKSFSDKFHFVSKKYYPATPKVTYFLNDEISQLENILSEKIAYFTKSLKHDFFNSDELGSFVCDLLKKMTDSDIVLLNSGSFREDIKKGYLTREKLFEVLPFDNIGMVFEMKKEDIISLIEKSFSQYRPLQMSGCFVTLKKEEKQNKTLFKVIDFQTLSSRQTYRVLVNSYTYSIMPDFFKKFTHRKYLSNIRFIVRKYLKMKKYVKVKEIKPRFKILEAKNGGKKNGKD